MNIERKLKDIKVIFCETQEENIALKKLLHGIKGFIVFVPTTPKSRLIYIKKGTWSNAEFNCSHIIRFSDLFKCSLNNLRI